MVDVEGKELMSSSGIYLRISVLKHTTLSRLTLNIRSAIRANLVWQ